MSAKPARAPSVQSAEEPPESVFEIFRVGIGPSSSHTVAPMRAAHAFAHGVAACGFGRLARIQAELYGSLGETGRGHGSDTAIVLGLCGEVPETVDPDSVRGQIARVNSEHWLSLLGRHKLTFDPEHDIVLHRGNVLPEHPNGMVLRALDPSGRVLLEQTYYSLGGGAIATELYGSAGGPSARTRSAAELLAACAERGLSVGKLTMEVEKRIRSEEEVRGRLAELWRVMQACLERGCAQDGVLPGVLGLRRRAPPMFRRLKKVPADGGLVVLDWVALFALAVAEENAAGGRIVTAPTNGAAGVVPAVLAYYRRFCSGSSDRGVAEFLLTAGAVGLLIRANASISGAVVGCQGEIGAACSMAAAGLAAVSGGSPRQVENAAEIAMEHSLGLTCDPIAGLVQVPCIERNAVAAIKAISAARLALQGDGSHTVSLDRVIATMLQTGADMGSQYKETSRGGLAVNLAEC